MKLQGLTCLVSDATFLLTLEVIKQIPSFPTLGLPYKLPFGACCQEQDDLTGRRKKKILLRIANPSSAAAVSPAPSSQGQG